MLACAGVWILWSQVWTHVCAGVWILWSQVWTHMCAGIQSLWSQKWLRGLECCHGPCLWCPALGCWTQTFPGHLPAPFQPSVSIGLFIPMETSEAEPWVPAPPPWARPLSIHLWEENFPSLMGEPVPEGVAFRRGFRRSYWVRGQMGPFRAVPPSQVTDEPSWDGGSTASPPEPRPQSALISQRSPARCLH